jgi:aminopeptidase N
VIDLKIDLIIYFSENLQRVKFKQTPLMSTYLVAFIVSEFKCTAGATVDGIPTEVCSRPGTEDTTKIAQETAPQILAAMQAYTGLSYKDFNIGKLTQAAIPDFSAGAMENWGLTTFRYSYSS